MQYSKALTDALQFMWGEGFLSPGGAGEIDDMLRGHDIAGKRVLDIGSGLGGIDALLAARYGAAEVVGIDVEAQLILGATELIAARDLADRVSFQLVEAGPLPFPEASFDMAFSKDAMVHIADKRSLFEQVLRVLKPGGVVVAADWLWAATAKTSPVVRAWLAGGPLKFAFTTPAEAARIMTQAGFADVLVVDRSHQLRSSNRTEVEMLEGPLYQRLASIAGGEMAAQRLHSARGRQAALDSGDLIPSHLKGRKPK